MMSLMLVVGFATYAVALAVSETDLFAAWRRLGRRAEEMVTWKKWLLTPVRATYCHTCFSFWAAIPLSLWAADISEWSWWPLLWFGATGLSVALRAFTPEQDQAPRLDEILAAQDPMKGREPLTPFAESLSGTPQPQTEAEDREKSTLEPRTGETE